MIAPESLTGDGVAADPNEELLALLDPAVPEARNCTRSSRKQRTKSRFLAGRRKSYDSFPHFVMHSTEYKKEYLDQVIPAALGPIKAREFPGRDDQQIYNSLTIGEVPLPVSDDQEGGVWGVALGHMSIRGSITSWSMSKG